MFASEKNDKTSSKPKTFKEATHKNSIKETTEKNTIKDEFLSNSDFFEDKKENEFNSNFFLEENMLKLNNFNEINEEERQIGSDENNNLEMFL